jgi:hypothetical protein
MRTLQTLDRRHNGYGRFIYRTDFRKSEILLFHEVREWCWSIWGSSCELDMAYPSNFPQGKELYWCWRSDTDHYKFLYFKGRDEASFFNLKWS